VLERIQAVLIQALQSARETAVQLGELSREEADTIHDFLTRDLYHAGRFLATEEREIADWLRLNALIVEQEIANRLSRLARKASLELKHLEKAKQRFDEWHTGEITGIGTLHCERCGTKIHFENAGHIPPCPKCHATVFGRGEP
jgi:hypothetical protein